MKTYSYIDTKYGMTFTAKATSYESAKAELMNMCYDYGIYDFNGAKITIVK